MTYRNEASEVARESRWTFFRFLPLFSAVIVTLALLGFGLRSLGMFGSTVVERKVFEQSYQRSEAIRSQIVTDEAVLTEIQRQLSSADLDEQTQFNLEAQAAAARVRIQSARAKQ